MTDTPSPQHAQALLEEWGAPTHLVRHARIVGEVARALAITLTTRGVSLDVEWVQSAAILHDAGKILHPEELHNAGHAHEEAGKALLLERGLNARLARICVTHAQWDETCTLDELLVALADGLWKGKRRPALEERVTREIACELAADFWDVYVWFDMCCESLAAQGDARLVASRG